MAKKDNQGERIASLETLVLEIKESLQRIESKVDEGRRNDDQEFKHIRRALKNDFDDFEQQLEKKFSPIWVRDLVIWAGGLLGTLVVAIIIKLFGQI